MNQVEGVLSAELRLSREWRPLLLGEDASVAELICVLDRWQAVDHLLLRQLLQGVEVDVAEAFVPLPGVVVGAGSKG